MFKKNIDRKSNMFHKVVSAVCMFTLVGFLTASPFGYAQANSSQQHNEHGDSHHEEEHHSDKHDKHDDNGGSDDDHSYHGNDGDHHQRHDGDHDGDDQDESGQDESGDTTAPEKQETTTTITNASELETPSIFDDVVTVLWSVLPFLSGTPTGTVDVTVNGETRCSDTVEAGGCSITPYGTGDGEVVAHYRGDDNFFSSDSAPVVHTVLEATTTDEGGNGTSTDSTDETAGTSTDNGSTDSGTHITGGGALLNPRPSGSSGTSTGTKTDNGTSTGEVLGASCELLLTSYIKAGANNPADQVVKLQTFLNKELGISLATNGVYDASTIIAVNVFQLKYSDDVLKPWVAYGLKNDKTPTGYVYKTTSHKINMINCPSLDLPMPQLP